MLSNSGGWSISASTLVDESTAAPFSASRRRSSSYRHSTPMFSFDVPEDPLHAAIGLESVLEHPLARPEDTASDGVVAHSLLDFSRRQVSSIRPHSSALSAMVTSHLPNPFSSVAPLAGGPTNIKVYFPRATQPSGQLLALTLPATATVEDAIALGLWMYWEKHWLPRLDASNARDTSIDSWIMLVPGKDAVVNKRIAQSSRRFTLSLTQLTTILSGKIASFHFDNFAIVRSPRNSLESMFISTMSHGNSKTQTVEHQVQKQISRFKLSAQPPATSSNNRHLRHRSVPIFASPSKIPDGPFSLSKLP
ncbi:hypothetical protein C8F04DRAFT_395354 [Mycena alexandri]|uniref:CRIM domain-containing protein n=1 Tax=Mycena alexandri TaxID=1745969 RepID=A0AAD6T1P3_9AGAR|nr:hypothetical protein C8F04DRAFT_395354 [Mycena alexandri]